MEPRFNRPIQTSKRHRDIRRRIKVISNGNQVTFLPFTRHIAMSVVALHWKQRRYTSSISCIHGKQLRQIFPVVLSFNETSVIIGNGREINIEEKCFAELFYREYRWSRANDQEIRGLNERIDELENLQAPHGIEHWKRDNTLTLLSILRRDAMNISAFVGHSVLNQHRSDHLASFNDKLI